MSVLTDYIKDDEKIKCIMQRVRKPKLLENPWVLSGLLLTGIFILMVTAYSVGVALA